MQNLYTVVLIFMEYNLSKLLQLLPAWQLLMKMVLCSCVSVLPAVHPVLIPLRYVFMRAGGLCCSTGRLLHNKCKLFCVDKACVCIVKSSRVVLCLQAHTVYILIDWSSNCLCDDDWVYE